MYPLIKTCQISVSVLLYRCRWGYGRGSAQPIKQAGQKIQDKIAGEGNGSDLPSAQIDGLVPQLVQMVGDRLDAEEMSEITVGQALDALGEAASEEEMVFSVRHVKR